MKEKKEKKEKVFIIGHKNPDTDSICSAIAYANLKNNLSNQYDYIPCRAGDISNETKFALRYFNIDEPLYIDDIGSQVMDMELRHTKGAGKDITINEAWNMMDDAKAVTLPILEGNKIIGIVTRGDIAETFMKNQDSYYLYQTAPEFEDIAKTLKGNIAIGNKKSKFDKGKVLVGAAMADRMQGAIGHNDLVILADRYENQMAALKKGAKCLVLCLGAKAQDDVLEFALKNERIIIETELDTYSVTREISKSVPIKAIMIKENIIIFNAEDSANKAREIMSETRHRAFPVIDRDGHYIGTVSRRNMLGIKKKKTILVDHNERSQAVDNIDDANIIEIIDHHRIGTIETLKPIYFLNQPVGCTATIIYELYMDKGIEIEKKIAGLLLSAILSDTLMFRSPTSTPKDEETAKHLAEITGLDIEAYATKMFEAGSDSSNKTAEEIFYQDYKKFTSGDKTFGIGQISSMSESELNKIKGKILEFLNTEWKQKGVDMVFFVLTNIKETSSELLFHGENSKEVIENSIAGAIETKDSYICPGMVSRKKQVVPYFVKYIKEL